MLLTMILYFSQPHFLLDILGSRRHQDMISWTFTDGFSFQIEKMKEVAELWSEQKVTYKKATKTTLMMQFARRDVYISRISFTKLSIAWAISDTGWFVRSDPRILPVV